MKDYLVRGTAAHDFVRAFAVTSRDVTETARKAHDLSPVASAALGRTMAAALMMGADLKHEKDVMTIQFLGDGPIGGITATANSKGEVKGFVNNPSVMLPPNQFGKLDVGGAVGKGTLHVLKDIGLKEPYAGQVDIQNGEIAEDLTYYFALSEQVPSVVALGVLMNREDGAVSCSGGYMIQLMPDCPEEIISELEKACVSAPPVTEMLSGGRTPEEILGTVLKDLDFRVTQRMDVSFHCDCSRERVEKALIAMGAQEIKSMIRDGKPVTLNCHFCNSDYTFSTDELVEVLKKCLEKKAGS
ncbi:MAG: Hsp33 family molecular chaperone HslO [Lachnospiraceae bacterium]|nr:Hsp33 family molecular chaperone HslO [Lachnospiraceae bacterium]